MITHPTVHISTPLTTPVLERNLKLKFYWLERILKVFNTVTKGFPKAVKGIVQRKQTGVETRLK
jgi:hypothetical protein